MRLTFERGSMLLSCGHWVELVRLDVTAERVVQVAAQTYGVERSQRMAEEMASAAPAERAEMMQQYAKQMVVQSTPGKYTKR